MTFILQKKHQTIVWNNSQSKKRRRKLKIPPYIICGIILIALSFFIALMHGIIKKNLPHNIAKQKWFDAFLFFNEHEEKEMMRIYTRMGLPKNGIRPDDC